MFKGTLMLIRDIDDPFEYGEEGQQTGGCEVELFPLTEYRDRLAERLDATSPPPLPDSPRAPAVRVPELAPALRAARAQAALDGPGSPA